MTEKPRTRIFISYRREGGIDTARWVHDQLRLRGYDVFLDMESLRGGSFNDALYDQIESRDVLLVVLTKDSLNRCFNRKDWVRQELAHAFRSGLKVIPLMKQDFEFPSRLPADIEPLRVQNGLRINFEFVGPFMDKLEKYILSEPQKPIRYHFPEQTGQWKLYTVLGLVTAALAGCLIFGIGSFIGGQSTDPTTAPTTAPTVDQTTSPTTSPTTEPTTAPTTAPTTPAAEQQLGNSTGNQCNDGVCETTTWYLTGNGVHYENRVGNWLYHYRDSDQTVRVRHTDDQESKTLATISNMGYFLVTTDWFYYTVEEGNVATLYRAPRLSVDQMGGTEELASGFSANNNVMIDGTEAYYWYTGKGLYKLDLSSLDETQVLEMETTWSTDTFGVSGDWIYFNTDSQIRRVKISTGETHTLLDITEQFEDGEIVTCNVDNAWVYFAVTDLGKTGFTHNDRVFRMHTDGSGLERIYVADGADCRISYIGLQLGQNSDEPLADYTAGIFVIAYGCADGRNSVYVGSGHYSVYAHTHDGDFAQTLGVHVGSNQTNLSNEGFVTYMPTRGQWIYASNAGEAYLNRFVANGDATYCYDGRKQAVILNWTEDSKTQTKSLLENVSCHYLFVTPDWLYCVLEEDGVNILYRAENDPENHSIGELEEVVSGFIIQNNNLVIQNGYVYYWMDEDGFYRARTDGGNVTKLWNRYGSGWRTFHVTEEKLYFWVGTYGMYEVSFEDGKLTELYGAEANGTRVKGAIEKNGKFYYIVQYKTEGIRTQPDEIWCYDPTVTEEGKAKGSLVYTMPDVSMAVTGLNRSETLLILQVKQDEGNDSYQVYSLTTDTAELKHWKDVE